MLIKLLGWFWIIMGIVFLIKPEMFRKRMQKKSLKKLKKILFLIALVLSVLLISAAWKTQGILSKVIMLVGIFGIFKAFFLLKAKSAEKILEWYLKQPLNFYRLGACIQIIIGIIIINM